VTIDTTFVNLSKLFIISCLPYSIDLSMSPKKGVLEIFLRMGGG
jgi:hypothetical protein